MKTSPNDGTSTFLDERNNRPILRTLNITTNSYSDVEPYRTVLSSNIDVFSSIAMSISRLEDLEVTKQVQQVLLNLYLSLQKESKYKTISNYLSRMNLVQEDDKTALLEWNFEDFRVGFKLELDKKESSYFIVSQDRSTGSFSANTQKLSPDLLSTIKKIVEYVLENT